MQVVDSLAVGGLERMAVNVANSLRPEHYRSHLCATRARGDLELQVSSHVGVLYLSRKGRVGLRALLKLRSYILENEIQILHAHGSSLFFAAIASLLEGDVKLVWHDHFGRFETEKRVAPIYRVAAMAVDGVISVSEPLANWARQRMHAKRVSYIANFAAEPRESQVAPCELPGTKGYRVVCVANFRPQKDHVNLLKAFVDVIANFPQAHLLLLGSIGDEPYFRSVKEAIIDLQLSAKVTWLGSRSDVQSLLEQCDIGVLSSSSEGLPLALLEYGVAKLAAMATDVGQCAEVLDHGQAGILVPPSSPESLGHALGRLLKDPETRQEYASAFARRVSAHYSAESVMRKIGEVYQSVLSNGKMHAQQSYSFGQ